VHLVNFICSYVEISAVHPSLVQRSPSECGALKCDGKTSIIKRPRLTGPVEPRKKSYLTKVLT
jgi:hypothetical protein